MRVAACWCWWWWWWWWCVCASGEPCGPALHAHAHAHSHAHSHAHALRCAGRAPLALVARLRSATADRRSATFQVRQVLAGAGPPHANDTVRVHVPAHARAHPLRGDSVYLLLAERAAASAPLRLLEPPLLQRCLPRGYKAQLRRAHHAVHASKHHCKANEEFRECGTKCPATCDYRGCTKTCLPGCFCKPGFVKDQGECISKTRPNYGGVPHLEIKPRVNRYMQGKQIQLNCRLQGVAPTHTMFWYKDGRRLNVKTNPRITVTNKKRGSVLVITNTTVNDSGLYECRDSRYRSLPVNVTVAYETTTLQHPCPMKDSDMYCLNGGTCFYYYALQVPSCSCPEGYDGERCENKIVSNPSSRYSYTCKLGLSTSFYC